MNLHQLVKGAINTINPFVSMTVRVSAGSTINPDGSRTPTYNTITVSAQVQSLSFTDITQLNGLGIQGVRRKLYLTGDIAGMIRVDKKGGDLVTFPDGSVWLVATVLEHWPDWVSVAITEQVNP